MTPHANIFVMKCSINVPCIPRRCKCDPSLEPLVTIPPHRLNTQLISQQHTVIAVALLGVLAAFYALRVRKTCLFTKILFSETVGNGKESDLRATLQEIRLTTRMIEQFFIQVGG